MGEEVRKEVRMQCVIENENPPSESGGKKMHNEFVKGCGKDLAICTPSRASFIAVK